MAGPVLEALGPARLGDAGRGRPLSTSPAATPGSTARHPVPLRTRPPRRTRRPAHPSAARPHRTSVSCRTGSRRRWRRSPPPPGRPGPSPGGPGLAGGSAEFGPEATIVSKARSSAPLGPHRVVEGGGELRLGERTHRHPASGEQRVARSRGRASAMAAAGPSGPPRPGPSPPAGPRPHPGWAGSPPGGQHLLPRAHGRPTSRRRPRAPPSSWPRPLAARASRWGGDPTDGEAHVRADAGGGQLLGGLGPVPAVGGRAGPRRPSPARTPGRPS